MKQEQKTKKSYPFNKTKFIEKYKKPTLWVRLINFWEGLKQALSLFISPVADENNAYPFVHIWGNAPNSNLYTLDDISIDYNMVEQEYYLNVETAYLVEGMEVWGNYLKDCLEDFRKFMDEQGWSTTEPFEMFMTNPSIELHADSIEGLYTKFRMFVNAFCATYELDMPKGENDEEDEDYDDSEFVY